MEGLAQYNSSTGKASFNNSTGKAQVVKEVVLCSDCETMPDLEQVQVTFSGVTSRSGCYDNVGVFGDTNWNGVPNVNNTYTLDKISPCLFLYSVAIPTVTRTRYSSTNGTCSGGATVATYDTLDIYAAIQVSGGQYVVGASALVSNSSSSITSFVFNGTSVPPTSDCMNGTGFTNQSGAAYTDCGFGGTGSCVEI